MNMIDLSALTRLCFEITRPTEKKPENSLWTINGGGYNYKKRVWDYTLIDTDHSPWELKLRMSPNDSSLFIKGGIEGTIWEPRRLLYGSLTEKNEGLEGDLFSKDGQQVWKNPNEELYGVAKLYMVK